MELLKLETSKVVEEVYVIEHPEHGVIIYKEWLNEKGKCIDCEVRDKSGYRVESDNEAALLEEIQEFVFSL